jgi:translation elongation factor P/translation initiation factor 5A
MNQPVELKKDDYTIQIKYSDEAVEKKLMKFISKSGDEFVISAEELASMLVSQVNSETLAATFVETDRVNVVEVYRQIQCVLDKDYQKGQVINIGYVHPLPIEFALIEEVAKYAKINMDAPAFTLTAEYIEEVKKKIKPEMEKYIETFYKSFKNLPKK